VSVCASVLAESKSFSILQLLLRLGKRRVAVHTWQFVLDVTKTLSQVASRVSPQNTRGCALLKRLLGSKTKHLCGSRLEREGAPDSTGSNLRKHRWDRRAPPTCEQHRLSMRWMCFTRKSSLAVGSMIQGCGAGPECVGSCPAAVLANITRKRSDGNSTRSVLALLMTNETACRHLKLSRCWQ
jgi:hypothetical protein